MPQSPIELKGSNFTLSVVHLHSSQPEVIYQALQERVKQAPTFLENAPVVINISSLVGEANWKGIQQAVASAGLRIIGISGCKGEAQKRELSYAGLPLLSEGRAQYIVTEPPASDMPEHTQNKTLFFSTPIRSGQQIYARNSDLIVTNSVSAGAELIADGNIHVYGMMRGKALAGAAGDANCQIFCTQLGAELISIAGQYWLSDQIPTQYLGQAARLGLINNALTIQPLN